MRGELWQGVLPGILRELYVGRRTGLLAFASGEERREVLEQIPLPEVETQRSLFGLVSTGVVEFQPGPPKARTRAQPLRALQAAEPAMPEPQEPVFDAADVAPEREPVVQAAPEDPRRLEIVEAHEGLRARTHFEVLGIARDATEAQVKEAYFRKAKRFHPDAHHDPALSDLHGKLEEVFIRLGEAYGVLRNPRIRASYERGLGTAPTPAVPGPDPKA